MRVRLFRFFHYNRRKSIFYLEERRPALTIPEKMKLYFNLERKIELPFLDLDVNCACNLKCRGCAKCIPYYTKKELYPATRVIAEFSELLAYVDTIYALSIIGGEPFLNRDIGEVIAYCSDCVKIRYVDITTNASVVPDESVFRILSQSRVMVIISNYPIPDPNFIENKRRFLEKLEEYGISYRFSAHEDWLDFGPVEKHDYSMSVRKMMYYCCPMNSCNVYVDRRIYRCGRARFIASYAPEEIGDVIDVRDIQSREQMRRAIYKFYRKSFSDACSYCRERPESMEPGIQILC